MTPRSQTRDLGHPTWIEQQQSIGFSKEEIESGKASREFSGSNFGDAILSPTVVICISYRPPLKTISIYHTAYIVDLFKLDSANGLRDAFKIGEDIDPKHLFLRMHVLNAISAD